MLMYSHRHIRRVQKRYRAYQDLATIVRSYRTLEKRLTGSVVIADEAHRLKEPRGQLGLAMKKIQCPSCFALTGTLIQNRLEEMWSVLDFVSQARVQHLIIRFREVRLVHSSNGENLS
jgi:SNF2 family DNA or RNA helicase